ncbi:RNA polymerase sigma factor, sigma-70 family [Virgibacillus subterraneus]|uniref:RNA polymerase sigma factor, sigma-70 family n=1 Tax=Virgibacillus subterraneus TaxID=621109 RepID=A0A1H9IEH4_9BACI|nr:sigma factor [Virgibacillus subterraneus]SEQ72918.1 RNA polymerase sigma factor, sigma-70 family [Virgibacillus subterraneus]
MSGYRDDPIQLNKEEILNELMAAHSEKLYLLAYSFVKDRGMAEDFSQDVFIKCYRHMDKYRGEVSVTSWFLITLMSARFTLSEKKPGTHSTNKQLIRQTKTHRLSHQCVSASYIKCYR